MIVPKRAILGGAFVRHHGRRQEIVDEMIEFDTRNLECEYRRHLLPAHAIEVETWSKAGT
jgi:acyl-CoA thioesterase FadM